MTRQEHDALQDLYNRAQEAREDRDMVFWKMQDLSYHVGGKRWCTIEMNRDEVLARGDKEQIRKALMWCKVYYESSGKMDALNELGRTLAELDFWKEARA